MSPINRRQFIICDAGVSGSLVLGVPLGTLADGENPTGNNENTLGFFLQIEANGIVHTSGELLFIDKRTSIKVLQTNGLGIKNSINRLVRSDSLDG